jgi:MtN3 and saliva related transmembrane protein
MEIPSYVVESVGAAAAVLTTLCWLPQALRVIRTRDARAISFSGYLTFAIGLAFWLAYGVLLGSLPLIGANVISLVLVTVILSMKLRHVSHEAYFRSRPPDFTNQS